MQTVSSNRGSHGKSAWAGIVFAVLYIGGVFVVGSTPGDIDKDGVNKSPSALTTAWRDFYSDSGNRWAIIIGAFILIVAAFTLVVFANEIRQRLVDAGAPGAAQLAFAASLLFAAATMAGATAMAWIPITKQFGNSALPEGEINYLTNVLGYGFMLMGGGVSAAVLLVISGRASVRTHVLPAWLGWAGVVSGIVVFFLSVFFLPMILFALWSIATAIIFLRRPPAALSGTLAPELEYGDSRTRSIA